MKYCPDNLEVCPDHPQDLVRREREIGAWIMNHERIGEHIIWEKYSCAECGKELKAKGIEV